jgi:WD40 repeat protein
MHKNSVLLRTFTIGMLVSISISVSAQETGFAREPIGESPYSVVSGWLKPFQADGFAFGGNSAIWAETSDRIIINQRGETHLPYPIPDDYPGFAGALGINVLTEPNRRIWQNCLFEVDGDGNLITVWEHLDYLCEGADGPGPERIRVNPYDPERKLWVVNQTHHEIHVLSNDGSQLIATHGERGVPGNDATHYGSPQDVTFMPDGRILVADGLLNHRVIIYDSDMNYLGEFGSQGDGPGQFNTIHSLAVGPEGRVFVTDRSGTNGVNLFRATDDPGVFVFERSIGAPLRLPLDIIVNEDDFWITDLGPLRFINFDFEGNLKYTWLVPRDLPDGFIEVHTFSVDDDGNLYGGDNQYGRTQKLIPKPNADPELLIEPPWVAN